MVIWSNYFDLLETPLWPPPSQKKLEGSFVLFLWLTLHTKLSEMIKQLFDIGVRRSISQDLLLQQAQSYTEPDQWWIKHSDFGFNTEQFNHSLPIAITATTIFNKRTGWSNNFMGTKFRNQNMSLHDHKFSRDKWQKDMQEKSWLPFTFLPVEILLKSLLMKSFLITTSNIHS